MCRDIYFVFGSSSLDRFIAVLVSSTFKTGTTNYKKNTVQTNQDSICRMCFKNKIYMVDNKKIIVKLTKRSTLRSTKKYCIIPIQFIYNIIYIYSIYVQQ